jgi:hypothetical protein
MVWCVYSIPQTGNLDSETTSPGGMKTREAAVMGAGETEQPRGQKSRLLDINGTW